MKEKQAQHVEIRLGTHGEDYGSWMSNPVFYMIGGLLAVAVSGHGLLGCCLQLQQSPLREERLQ